MKKILFLIFFMTFAGSLTAKLIITNNTQSVTDVRLDFPSACKYIIEDDPKEYDANLDPNLQKWNYSAPPLKLETGKSKNISSLVCVMREPKIPHDFFANEVHRFDRGGFLLANILINGKSINNIPVKAKIPVVISERTSINPMNVFVGIQRHSFGTSGENEIIITGPDAQGIYTLEFKTETKLDDWAWRDILNDVTWHTWH